MNALAGRADLPIPAWLFAVAAVAVLVVSFVLVRWRQTVPRSSHPPADRPLCRGLSVVGSGIGLALLGLVLVSGAQGTPTITANFAPTFIFVVFWIGVPLVSVALGDVFALFNPCVALARIAERSWSALGGRSLRPPRPYPSSAGRWPAAVTLGVFLWVDLVYSRGSDPRLLAVLVAAYVATQLVGISVFGIVAWTRNGDAFGVLFSLFSQLSPVELTRTTIALRRPLEAVGDREAVAGTTAVLCVVIGAVSFDGFTSTTLWRRIEPDLTGFAFDRGADLATAREIGATLGLAGCIAVVAAAFMAALSIGRPAQGHGARRLARHFGPTLIPIAAAYLVAHYASLLLYQGQAAIALLSDPLGDGRDIFGTATLSVDYGLISATAIWYFQALVLLAGHVAGLASAHDEALRVFRTPERAARSQLSMLAVMIAFTLLALSLLASISV